MGDVGAPAILDDLRRIAPLRAIRGNVDYGAWANELPETDVVEVFGEDAYLIHNIGELDLDPQAAGLRFVFYGHSHSPAEEMRDGVAYVNPGSIGPRRFRLPVSLAFLEPDLSVTFLTLEA